MKEKLSMEMVFGCLSDGHSVWTPELAEKICGTVGVKFDKTLVRKYYSDAMHSNPKGLRMKREGDEGVSSLNLSWHIANELDVVSKAGCYNGRGFQAQAYAKAIRDELDRRRTK